MERHVRQAVVIVHGMGEQRPLDTLNEFIGAALEADKKGRRTFHSRPDRVTDSFESRRYLAPVAYGAAGEIRAQTEFFEYHWAHLMQGNRLDDLWPAFRRMLLTPPWYVPKGLRLIWLAFWALLVAGMVLFLSLRPGLHLDLADLTIADAIKAIAGGGLTAVALTYVITRWLPGWLTSSFVDVVRYLDTSPRSYQVRHDIRAGIVDLLQGLHDAGRYQRIIIVAHSLGSYIAYDAVSALWAQMNKLHAGPVPPAPGTPDEGEAPDGLAELEAAAGALNSASDAADYQAAQRRLWLGLRAQGNPWLITDLLTFGSPMCMADRIYTRNREDFETRKRMRELPACPPLPDLDATGADSSPPRLTWNNRGRRVLYHGAPFAVVRWTNMWFPAHLWFFGDWFGGALRPLYGNGIVDRALTANGWRSRVPGWAHALYYHFQADEDRGDSVTCRLREAMDLASTAWLEPTLDAPRPDLGSA